MEQTRESSMQRRREEVVLLCINHGKEKGTMETSESNKAVPLKRTFKIIKIVLEMGLQDHCNFITSALISSEGGTPCKQVFLKYPNPE